MLDTARTLDRYFSDWVVKHFSQGLSKKDSEILMRLAEATSLAVSLKHTCLDLEVSEHLGEPIFKSLLNGIKASDVKRVLESPVSPLMRSVDGRYIWLQKYYAFDCAVAEKLLAMQRDQRLEIITGGPGTGKTWSAAQRIKNELEKNPHCIIKLAAPTGKAANNMMNALMNAGFDTTKHALKGLTLHALLGLNGNSPKPRHNCNNPLACDLLIVDEASMIDLPMMYRLLDAMPKSATLLLLGDKDQLASVEAGSVLADICAALQGDACIRSLTESRRYKNSPEIGALAVAVNAGDVPDMSSNQRVLLHLSDARSTWSPAWLAQAATGYGWIAEALKSQLTPLEMLKLQTQFQVLSALREGPFGVDGINRLIAEKLGHKLDAWYAGQPVMVTQNDHNRKLYNGDVGMVLAYEGQLKACFIVNNEIKAISKAQMPAFETCYAITVHKSQGSEYEHVMIVLPADAETARVNPVLTRELVYTAITRAKSKIDLWAGEGVLQAMAQKTTQRMSGLKHLFALCREVANNTPE